VLRRLPRRSLEQERPQEPQHRALRPGGQGREREEESLLPRATRPTAAATGTANCPQPSLVAPANENEKRHFKEVASKAKERFPNAKWHVADNQYSSKRLRRFIKEDLKGRPVIPKRRDEKRGAGDFYVDKTFRCRGDARMCRLYGMRTASERMNSRAERLMGRNTLRGLARVGGYVGVALTLMLLIAVASYRRGRPELARSIEYYASH